MLTIAWYSSNVDSVKSDLDREPAQDDPIPQLSEEDVRSALRVAAAKANQLNREIRDLFLLTDTSAALILDDSGRKTGSV